MVVINHLRPHGVFFFGSKQRCCSAAGFVCYTNPPKKFPFRAGDLDDIWAIHRSMRRWYPLNDAYHLYKMTETSRGTYLWYHDIHIYIYIHLHHYICIYVYKYVCMCLNIHTHSVCKQYERLQDISQNITPHGIKFIDSFRFFVGVFSRHKRFFLRPWQHRSTDISRQR